MSDRAKVLIAAWLAWGAGVIGSAIKNAEDEAAFGVIAGIALAIVTVKLLKK